MLPLRMIGWMAAVLSIPAILSGCGNTNLPQTSVVKGRVTYQGDPVEGATVIFGRGNRNMGAGEVALGKTDSNGDFSLTTHLAGQTDVKGAVPGEYKVTISKHVPPPNISAAAYQAKVDAANKIAEEGGMVAPGDEPPAMVELLPGKYSSPAQTELTAEVQPGVVNDFPFELQ